MVLLLTGIGLSGGDDASLGAARREDDDVEAAVYLAHQAISRLAMIDAVIQFDQAVGIGEGCDCIVERETSLAQAEGVFRLVPFEVHRSMI